jgi:2-keto-4-pentenoate hydratase
VLSDEERQAVADALFEAAQSGVAIDPVTDTWEKLDVVDAYDIQLRNVRRRIEAGAIVKGHKVGLAAKAMQQMVGVNEPDYGTLLHDMFYFEHDEIPVDRVMQARVEIEVAFVLGRPLRGPGVTAADVVMATDYLLPSLEVVGSRVRDWKITIGDTIADNASAGCVVLGGSPTRLRDVDPRTIGAVLRKNGEIVDTGCSGAVLGNPVTAVAWLANKVADFGVTLEAGHVVLPGSCTRMSPVAPGDVVRADFDVLGHVAASFV